VRPSVLRLQVGKDDILTAPLAGYERGSSTWSAESLVGRESRDARNDLAKESSVILPKFYGFKSDLSFIHCSTKTGILKPRR
jgi:hypothetical protein